MDAPVTTTSSYDALRDAIVRGDLAPDARLVEADLSSTFAMSRGAVRTALIRLEQDGLVVREPHRGARVRRVSDEEAVEILQARAVLEGLAARQAADRIDDGGRGRLREFLARQRGLLEGGDLLAASDVNAELHATLLEISGHRTATRLINTLSAQSVRYQYRTILIPGRPSASVEEHAAIVEAVSDGRAADAERAMRRHLLNVADAVRRGRLPGGIDSASRGII
jgi:DNA-binding GntR family transcriptional regulator